MRKYNFFIMLIILLTSTTCCSKVKKMKIMDIEEKIEFDFFILNSPVIWKDQKSGKTAIAFASYKEYKEAGYLFKIESYWLDGSRNSNFPINLWGEKKVASLPLYQFSTADINNDKVDELIIIDQLCRVYAINHDGKVLKGYPKEQKRYDQKKDLWVNKPVKPEKDEDIIFPAYVSNRYTRNKSQEYHLDIFNLDAESIWKNSHKVKRRIININPFFPGDEKMIFMYSNGEVDYFDYKKMKSEKNFPMSIDRGFADEFTQMELMKSKDSVVISYNKPHIVYVNYLKGKQEKVKIPKAKKIKRISLSKMMKGKKEKEVLYLYDEENKQIIKLKENNKIDKKLKLDLEEQYDNTFFKAVQTPDGKSNFIFCTFNIYPMLDINALYDKYGDKNLAKKEERETYKAYYNELKTKKLPKDIIKIIKRNIIEFKRDYLTKKFGLEQFHKLRFSSPEFRTIIIKDGGKGLKKFKDEKIINYVRSGYETSEFYTKHEPIIYSNYDSKRIYFLLPLNFSKGRTENDETKSMFRNFTLEYQ